MKLIRTKNLWQLVFKEWKNRPEKEVLVKYLYKFNQSKSAEHDKNFLEELAKVIIEPLEITAEIFCRKLRLQKSEAKLT